MRDFRRLTVWQKSHQLTLDVYRVTADFPAREQYGLTSQLRRSCASIPANISEGCGRESNADFARFLTLASGSASETEYHLLLARDLTYLSGAQHDSLESQVQEIKRMLTGLMQKVRS
jgi:four helix bundle protein